MLDDRLREIIESDATFEMMVAQIKQAFADEGYRLTRGVKEERIMSGSDWYDRFRKEYRALSPNAYAKDRYAKMAAEKASGI